MLVVEDDAGVRAFIVECLHILGFAVGEEPYGRAGLNMIASQAPQLLIVDYAMPEMNGVEVVKEARRLAPDLAILLATGYADMDAVHEVVGPQNVLGKAISLGGPGARGRDGVPLGLPHDIEG